MSRLVIDRLEEEFAVCEDEQGFRRLLLKELLPEGAGEGSVLYEGENGSFLLDEEETVRRRSRFSELQEELFR